MNTSIVELRVIKLRVLYWHDGGKFQTALNELSYFRQCGMEPSKLRQHIDEKTAFEVPRRPKLSAPMT
jgi:hypothetical protein